MSHPIIVITNGNYFARLVLDKVLRQEKPRIAGILLITGDYKARTGFNAVWHLARQTAWPYLFYKIWTILAIRFAQMLFPRKPLTVLNIARRKGIPVHASTTVNCDAARNWVASMQPELIVSVSCPQLIGREMISIARRGGINIHSSLLPRYAGLAPYFWVLSCGEQTSGTSVHYLSERFDTGNILRQERLDIQPRESAFGLFKRLAMLGSNILAEAVDLALSGEPGAVQDASIFTYFSQPTWKAYFNLRRRRRVLVRISELVRSVREELAVDKPTSNGGAIMPGERLLNTYRLPIAGAGESASHRDASPEGGETPANLLPSWQDASRCVASLKQYAAAVADSGATVVEGAPGTFWQSAELRAMVRRPDFCLAPPSAPEIRGVLRHALAPVASYSRHPDADHPQNAWLYVCEDQGYNLEKLALPARRDIRRALRAFRFEFIDHWTLLEKGERCFCDTRRRILLDDGTPEVFRKTYRNFGQNPAHKILAAWAGDCLAAYLTLTVVDDWVDIFPFAADEHLRSCPINGLIHVCLDYFLVRNKFRLINYGLSSIQEVSKAKGLHAFKRKVGFEARPVHRGFVFHLLMRPFVNKLMLDGLRMCERFWPRNLAMLKASGLLATHLGQNPMPDDPNISPVGSATTQDSSEEHD